MDSYGCGCKNVIIIEGIFGEIYPDLSCYKGEDLKYNQESFESLIEDSNEGFNELKPIIVKSYTMINNNRMEVTVITWGASIVSLKCPDKFGHSTDVVLGFDDLKSYMNPVLNPFIGCVLGRCANRIRNGCFSIKDKDYELTKNDNNHHLHGGANGFGRQIWNSHIDDCSVVMSYLSEDGEEGYPGAVLATVRFKLTPDNKLEIHMRATTSKSTIINMSHGSLFNLAGHDAGEVELRKHKILLNCDRWTFSDYSDSIPTGAIRGVGGTIMDLRIPRILGEYMDVLEVYSNQPGLQFYTGGRLLQQFTPSTFVTYDHCVHQQKLKTDEDINNYLSTNEENKENGEELLTPDVKPLQFLTGKKGAHYKKNCAFSIQPQNYPNAINYVCKCLYDDTIIYFTIMTNTFFIFIFIVMINIFFFQAHFPCAILYPGQVYCHDLTYKFGIQLANYM
ncbi:galactose mutarotase-like isoform X3 [Vespa velutina]|uniref:galactose mutarotase-like isoform X3 n=1 Tax=Vespa velutina TaxID=202808 RepID=UPI001FB4E63E|nr:galactose mutarotase-like isoform X3 [Vespa velutina]